MSTSWEKFGHPGHDDPLGIADHTRKLSFVLTINLLKTKQIKEQGCCIFSGREDKELYRWSLKLNWKTIR